MHPCRFHNLKRPSYRIFCSSPKYLCSDLLLNSFILQGICFSSFHKFIFPYVSYKILALRILRQYKDIVFGSPTFNTLFNNLFHKTRESFQLILRALRALLCLLVSDLSEILKLKIIVLHV